VPGDSLGRRCFGASLLMRICIMVWIHLDPPNTRMWRDDLTITANQSGLRLVSYPLTYRDDWGALDPRLAHAPLWGAKERKKEVFAARFIP
jgi:hypothetical protein